MRWRERQQQGDCALAAASSTHTALSHEPLARWFCTGDHERHWTESDGAGVREMSPAATGVLLVFDVSWPAPPPPVPKPILAHANMARPTHFFPYLLHRLPLRRLETPSPSVAQRETGFEMEVSKMKKWNRLFAWKICTLCTSPCSLIPAPIALTCCA